MKCACRALAVVALVSSASAAQVNPIQKVVQLLADLEAKIKADGDSEAAAYEAYAAFCTSDTREKGYEIKTAKAQIEDLTATIQKATTDASTASSRIVELSGGMATNEADLKAATEIRNKERTDFLAIEADLVESEDVLNRAINILERKGSALVQTTVSMKNIKQLVQALNTILDAAAVSIQDQKRLTALVQNAATAGDDDDTLGAPAAKAYESHAGSIIDVLEDLREKASQELRDARKQEVSETHNYEMMRQSLQDDLAAQEKATEKAKTVRAAASETKAAAQGNLGVTQKDLASTEAALAELTGACTTAASDHEASVKSRAEELEAVAAAKQALLEKTGGAEAVVYSSLLQTDTDLHLDSGVDLANFEVVNLVRQLAKKTHSTELAQLATRIAAVMRHSSGSAEDPFAKVKELIQALLAKLQQEAGAEADHKAYCDKETATTKEKIDDLKNSADALAAKIDTRSSRSATLKGEVAELQAELADLAKSQVTMDETRATEHAAFVQTKADLEQGLEGVRLALRILREHYEEGTALAQQPEAPTYHEKSVGAATGILGMLEVIESDLGKSLAQSEVQEDTAAEEYEKLTQTNKIAETMKQQDVKYKTSEAGSLDKAAAELSADHRSTQTELDAVLDYSESIRAQCEVKPETYEERRARREAELAGLKEALEILEGQAMLQKRSFGLRGAAPRKHQ